MNENWTLSLLMQNTNWRSKMHPSTSSITISAHVRDLQRAMHPERRKPRRRPLAWIRKHR
jgi:hypothetical protein